MQTHDKLMFQEQ